MKTILLLAALLLSACATPSRQWEAAMQARNTAPGVGIEGQCSPFVDYMKAAIPFPTQRVTWTATNNAPFPQTIRHQVVAYHVGREVWFLDNYSISPRWVGNEGEPWDQMAKQFYSPAFVHISNVAVSDQ